MSAKRKLRARSQQSRTTRLHLETLDSRVVPTVAGIEDCDHHDGERDIHFNPFVVKAPEGADSGGSGAGGLSFGDNPGLIPPAYSSLPGAAATLYLDFNGHFDSQWGSYSNVDTAAYDIDGNAASFSTTELDNIYRIWRAVSEDYAPFNINVTTVLPSSFANGTAMRVAIGGNGSWTGGTYGGVAYLNSFTNSVVNTAYVFSANLGNGYARYVADAVAHESGHTFGLNHQSQYSGTTLIANYYAGPGDGTAPLMGNSYSAARSLWWYGTATSSSYQNDVAIISGSTNGFGFRADDHGNSTATASTLTASATGSVSGSGIVGSMTDRDYFSFTTSAGALSLTANVLAEYNDLDARLDLYDSAGNLVASSDPSNSFGASIATNVSAGTFYLVVSSHGASDLATSANYGFNIGQFTLSGTIGPVSGQTPAAPSALTASAASASAVNLAWADNSGTEDGFRIERLDNGTWVQVASVGANVTAWSDTGLNASTTYTYRVRAFNATGNSDYSNTASGTTSSNQSTPVAPSSLRAAVKTKGNLQVTLNWLDNSTNETGFRIERSTDGGTTWSTLTQVGANVASYADRAVTTGATYSYRVFAFNGVGSSSASNNATVTIGGGGRGNRGLSLASLADLVSVDTWSLDAPELAVKAAASSTPGAPRQIESPRTTNNTKPVDRSAAPAAAVAARVEATPAADKIEQLRSINIPWSLDQLGLASKAKI